MSKFWINLRILRQTTNIITFAFKSTSQLEISRKSTEFHSSTTKFQLNPLRIYLIQLT